MSEVTLHDFCKNGDIEQVKYLVSIDPHIINKKNDDGQFPLYIACKNGYYDIALFLIDNGASINKKILIFME